MGHVRNTGYSDVPNLSGTEGLMNYERNTEATGMFHTYLTGTEV